MYEGLLETNSGLLAWAAGRYIGACQRDPAVDYDDLVQAGFLGLVRASETYSEGLGGSWGQWATWYITKEIEKTLGRRDGRWVKAHTGAISLDTPICEDTDETWLDALEDDSPPVDTNVIMQDDGRVVREAVADLKNDQQRETVQRWQLDGETQAQVAQALGVSPARVHEIWRKARKTLERDKRLRALVDLEDRTPYYMRVGVDTFKSTRTSATEYAAMWRLDHRPPPPPSPA